MYNYSNVYSLISTGRKKQLEFWVLITAFRRISNQFSTFKFALKVGITILNSLNKGRRFSSISHNMFYGQSILHYIDRQHFADPFISWMTLSILHLLTMMNNATMNIYFNSLRVQLWAELLGHNGVARFESCSCTPWDTGETKTKKQLKYLSHPLPPDPSHSNQRPIRVSLSVV